MRLISAQIWWISTYIRLFPKIKRLLIRPDTWCPLYTKTCFIAPFGAFYAGAVRRVAGGGGVGGDGELDFERVAVAVLDDGGVEVLEGGG